MSFVLVGNYGDGNMGDEALRQYFLTEYSSIDWKVVSAKPSTAIEIPRLPCGIRSFFSPWWRTIIAIYRCKGVVFGGGTLFTDIESLSACILWGSYVCVARLLRKPYFLAFQGVGPFRTKVGESIARWVYKYARFTSVRDDRSLDRLRGWGQPNAILTFDPAFAFFAAHVRVQGHRKALIVIPRQNSTEDFFHTVEQCFRAEKFDVVRIVLMQPTDAERAMARRVQEIVLKAEVIEPVTIDDVLSEVSRAALVVSQRYHGSLAALGMHVPVESVPLARNDKLSSLESGIDTTKREELLSLVRAGSQKLFESLQSL